MAYLTRSPGAPCPLHPYVVAKLAEDPEMELNADLTKQIQAHRREGWTVARVAALNTAALEEKIREFGVPYSRDTFIARAKLSSSGFALAETWMEEYPVIARRRDQKFLPLAVVELWKRLLPGHPSVETLDDQMQEGYGLLRDGRDEKAVGVWWNLWLSVRTHLPAGIRSSEDVKLVAGTQMFSNWVDDFLDLLDCCAESDPRVAARGVEFGRDLLLRFPEESESSQVNWRRTLAGHLFIQGRVDEGRSLLEEIVRLFPTNAWGYIALADEYAHLWKWRGNRLPLDLDRARKYLEEGLEVASTHEDRAVLVERLKELDGHDS
ncbi:MAG: hypothetical protein HY815_17180 [Candidatus Riflebacteria bacterium]|nr:hypothetical protein [Candidatus Riflebacteria bacterium]